MKSSYFIVCHSKLAELKGMKWNECYFIDQKSSSFLTPTNLFVKKFMDRKCFTKKKLNKKHKTENFNKFKLMLETVELRWCPGRGFAMMSCKIALKLS